MSTLDWILTILLLVGALRGLRAGAIKQLVSLVGIIVGLILAKMFYMALGEVLSPHLGDNVSLANGVAFVAIWVLVPAVLGLIAELVTTVLDKILIVGTLNKLLGALFGVIKYGFLLGAVAWALVACKLLTDEALSHSVIGTTLKAFSEAFYTALINA